MSSSSGDPLVEAIPNFSEGRDRALIDAIAAALEGEGAHVLHVDPNPDANRTVITLAGPPPSDIGMAMSCDLRIASEKAKFGTAFARVGFGGDYGTSWQLTRLVGQAKAKELFFLPDIIQADEAHRIGLANRVLGAENFVDDAHAIAARIANGPLVSYRYMKENVNMSLTTDFKTILDREAMTHLRCGQTDDHKEGVAAFMEKREPVFVGR